MPRLLLTVFFALAFFPAPVNAQTDAQDTADEAPETTRPLDTITVVATRTERALSDVAATISVKSAEEMDRELTRDIADLVRFEPGVSVGGSASRFGLSGFNIRGIGGNRVLTVVDGVRVPEEFSFGPFLSSRRDFVDIDSLNRAEIARGPISSLYGSDALGGVVALSTKGPNDYLDDGEAYYGGFKTGYSGADDSTVNTITMAAGNDRLSGLLLYTRRDGHETENSGSIGGTGVSRERPDPQSIASNNLVAKLSFSPKDRHTFTLGIDQLDSSTETQILSDYGTVAFGTTSDRRDANDERERSRQSLSYRYDGNLSIADTVHAQVYGQSAESLQLTDENRTTAGGDAQTRQRESSFDQDIEGAFLQFTKSLDAAGANHRISYGADYYQTDNRGRRTGGTYDGAGNPLPEFLPLPTRDFPPTEVTQTALFLQDEIALFDGRLLLSPGVRYDRFEADATADALYLNGNPGTPLPEDYDDSEVTAKIGAVYALTEAVSAYARYSEGFRAPPYDDVNVGFTNFIGGYKTISNPNLESERSEGLEIGMRLQGELGSLGVAAFQNDYDNFIESFAIAPEFLDSGGIDPADGVLTFQSINRNEVDIRGAELSGSLKLGAVSERLSDISLRLAVAYAEGKDKDSGEPINSIEPLSGILGVAYRSSSDRWGAELIWTLVDDKTASDIDANNPRVATSGYGLVDILGHVSLTERVEMDLGLFNLGDRSYVRWADTASTGNDALLRFTQPGFNAGVNLRIEL